MPIPSISRSWKSALMLAWLAVPAQADDGRKMTVCHVPPGNPSARHTISIGERAVDAHLDHGDYLGGCRTARGASRYDDDRRRDGRVDKIDERGDGRVGKDDGRAVRKDDGYDDWYDAESRRDRDRRLTERRRELEKARAERDRELDKAQAAARRQRNRERADERYRAKRDDILDKYYEKVRHIEEQTSYRR